MGLSTEQVLKILGITKVTLYKWIDKGKIKPIERQIGGRTYHDFPAAEVARVKALKVKNPEKGKSLLKGKK